MAKTLKESMIATLKRAIANGGEPLQWRFSKTLHYADIFEVAGITSNPFDGQTRLFGLPVTFTAPASFGLELRNHQVIALIDYEPGDVV